MGRNRIRVLKGLEPDRKNVNFKKGGISIQNIEPCNFLYRLNVFLESKPIVWLIITGTALSNLPFLFNIFRTIKKNIYDSESVPVLVPYKYR